MFSVKSVHADQWLYGNAGSCRWKQIPVSPPPVVQTGALSLLTRQSSCLTRAIRPSCCFFTLVYNSFNVNSSSIYRQSGVSLCPLRWLTLYGCIPNQSVKEFVKMTCWPFCQSKISLRYCEGSVTCQISVHVFPINTVWPFAVTAVCWYQDSFFQKLMWMPLMYAWMGSFWWSVKEMETFIWSMFHTRKSFSPG